MMTIVVVMCHLGFESTDADVTQEEASHLSAKRKRNGWKRKSRVNQRRLDSVRTQLTGSCEALRPVVCE